MIDDNEDILDGTELEKLHPLLKEAMAEEIVENYDFSALTLKASNFLKIYEKESIQLEQANAALIKAKTLDAESPTGKNIDKKTLKAKRLQCLKNIYKAAFQFDDELAQYLYGNKVPKMGYFVLEDNTTHKLTAYPISLEEMAERIYTDDGKSARIDLSKTALENFMQATNRQALEDQSEDAIWQDKVMKARAAFIGTQNRLDVYYNNLSEELGKKTQRQGGYLLWKQHNEWKWIQVANSGDLKEAYVQMIYEDHVEKITGIKDIGIQPYYSHELIGLYAGYIGTVTNTPAILEEDVVTLSGQFGIKSKKAPLPTLGQYLFAAQTVINAIQKGNTSKEYIAGLIAKKYNQDTARSVEKEAQGIAKIVLDKTIEDFEKRLFNKN